MGAQADHHNNDDDGIQQFSIISNRILHINQNSLSSESRELATSQRVQELPILDVPFSFKKENINIIPLETGITISFIYITSEPIICTLHSYSKMSNENKYYYH